jgi:hypothetical protein
MGHGAQEKTEVAVEFQRRAAGLGLKLDIETDEQRRIYGAGWYDFVANCRGMIGTEAGVSITDLTGEVRADCERLLALNPQFTFAEMSKAFLHKWEDFIPQRVISPRHFEAAAFPGLPDTLRRPLFRRNETDGALHPFAEGLLKFRRVHPPVSAEISPRRDHRQCL